MLAFSRAARCDALRRCERRGAPLKFGIELSRVTVLLVQRRASRGAQKTTPSGDASQFLISICADRSLKKLRTGATRSAVRTTVASDGRDSVLLLLAELLGERGDWTRDPDALSLDASVKGSLKPFNDSVRISS